MIETDVVNEEVLLLLSEKTMKKADTLILRMIQLKCWDKNSLQIGKFDFLD